MQLRLGMKTELKRPAVLNSEGWNIVRVTLIKHRTNIKTEKQKKRGYIYSSKSRFTHKNSLRKEGGILEEFLKNILSQLTNLCLLSFKLHCCLLPFLVLFWKSVKCCFSFHFIKTKDDPKKLFKRNQEENTSCKGFLRALRCVGTFCAPPLPQPAPPSPPPRAVSSLSSFSSCFIINARLISTAPHRALARPFIQVSTGNDANPWPRLVARGLYGEGGGWPPHTSAGTHQGWDTARASGSTCAAGDGAGGGGGGGVPRSCCSTARPLSSWLCLQWLWPRTNKSCVLLRNRLFWVFVPGESHSCLSPSPPPGYCSAYAHNCTMAAIIIQGIWRLSHLINYPIF